MMRKSIILVVIMAIMLTVSACGGGEKYKNADRNLTNFQFTLASLSATDNIGRTLSPVNGFKLDRQRYVGIFYSLWLGQHVQQQKDIYDISKLLEENPEALWDENGNLLSPLEEFHFCGEPLYGYYSMTDPWVVSRHVELLTLCGIDYLMIDATNTVIYPSSANVLFDTLLKYQNQGFNVPKVVFYTNTNSGSTVKKLYDTYYVSGEYEKIWFKPKGKPAIVGITENNNGSTDQTNPDLLSQAMKIYFDVYESQWPNRPFNELGWPWMSWDYPQFVHDEGRINVSVAQHSPLTAKFSEEHPVSSRGYNHITKKIEENWMAGANFQTQWQSVFDYEEAGFVEINNVLVTSFNEWMAIKYAAQYPGYNNQKTFFVDVFNYEYSRDIEMAKGAYGDNFLMQLAQNIKKYKFDVAYERYNWGKHDISIDDLSTWDSVKLKYLDFNGDAMERNHRNAANTATYTDKSNRNDIVSVQVTNDGSNLYFLIKTADDITEHNGTDLNWMNILIKTRAGGESFSGYQYIINRSPKTNGKTSIEKSVGGYDFTNIGEADYRVNGSSMAVKIPFASLGLTKDDFYIEFKVADNVTNPHDIMDYYITGDSAPIGRFNYTYGY